MSDSKLMLTINRLLKKGARKYTLKLTLQVVKGGAKSTVFKTVILRMEGKKFKEQNRMALLRTLIHLTDGTGFKTYSIKSAVYVRDLKNAKGEVILTAARRKKLDLTRQTVADWRKTVLKITVFLAD